MGRLGVRQVLVASNCCINYRWQTKGVLSVFKRRRRLENDWMSRIERNLLVFAYNEETCIWDPFSAMLNVDLTFAFSAIFGNDDWIITLCLQGSDVAVTAARKMATSVLTLVQFSEQPSTNLKILFAPRNYFHSDFRGRILDWAWESGNRSITLCGALGIILGL